MKDFNRLQVITKEIAEQTNFKHIPSHIIDKINKMRKVEKELFNELDREPTYEEIAVKMGRGIKIFHVKEMKRIIQENNLLANDNKY